MLKIQDCRQFWTKIGHEATSARVDKDDINAKHTLLVKVMVTSHSVEIVIYLFFYVIHIWIGSIEISLELVMTTFK